MQVISTEVFEMVSSWLLQRYKPLLQTEEAMVTSRYDLEQKYTCKGSRTRKAKTRLGIFTLQSQKQ